MLPSSWRKGFIGMGLIITWTTNKSSAAFGISKEYQVPEISFAPVIQVDTDSGNYSMLSMTSDPSEN